MFILSLALSDDKKEIAWYTLPLQLFDAITNEARIFDITRLCKQNKKKFYGFARALGCIETKSAELHLRIHCNDLYDPFDCVITPTDSYDVVIARAKDLRKQITVCNDRVLYDRIHVNITYRTGRKRGDEIQLAYLQYEFKYIKELLVSFRGESLRVLMHPNTEKYVYFIKIYDFMRRVHAQYNKVRVLYAFHCTHLRLRDRNVLKLIKEYL